jgi:hypothetical protein
MHQATKLFKALKEGFISFDGSHDIHTPQALVEEILSKIDLGDKKILVLFNIEFVISLVYTYNIAPDNITFYSDHENKGKMCAKMGVKYITNLETDMRFDVVVGNPPYQTGNGESGGKHSLWRKFIKKSFELCDNNGYIGIVCPGFPYKAKDIGKYFKENTPLVLNNDVSSYFPGIGSDIKYWIVKKGNHNLPFVVDGQIWTNGLEYDPTIPVIVTLIRKKIDKFDKFECKQDRGYSSTQLKNDDNDYFTHPTRKSIYPIRHGSINKVCYVKEPTECHTKRKVMMVFSGYPAFEYYDETTPMSSCYQMSGYIQVANKKEGNALIKLYSSKLYTWLSNPFNKGTFKGVVNYSLPKVDLNKSWSDEELYTHFNLTPEEIDYIEANVK